MPFNPKTIQSFPAKPGVYLMKNKAGQVIYVGKAKNLRQRVKQYFIKSGDGRFMIPFLISHVESIDTMIVCSEKEALLLENNLIKQYKPRYNVLLKDDKSYIALKLTHHKWPRIDLVRYKGKPKSDGNYFGPYTHAGAARKTLDLLQKLFPLRQCSDQEFLKRTRPCILYDIKKCAAPCVGYCTEEEYANLVDKTVKFLKGQDKEIIQDLYKEIEYYASKLEFERAGEIHRTVQYLEKTIEGQYVDKPLGVDADVIGIFREGEEVIVVVLIFNGGRLSGASHYNFSKVAQDDQELISSLILQHYESAKQLPKEILVPLALNDGELLSEILSSGGERAVHVHTPQRGEKKRLIELAHLNAEASFKKEKDENEIRERTLLQIQEKFRLNQYPRRIECFDISTNSGTQTVAAMVAFTDGKKESGRYRKFHIKSIEGLDDYGAIREVLSRRLKRAKEENNIPDLLMIDGGKGHLNVALGVLKELNIISVDVISIAKEEGRHDKGQTLEQVFIPGVKDPIMLGRHSQILFLLQRIRDEAHRTALTFHRTRRKKELIKSALDEIPGIGQAKKISLLKHFGSVKRIKEATESELREVKGISQSLAKEIMARLR